MSIYAGLPLKRWGNSGRWWLSLTLCLSERGRLESHFPGPWSTLACSPSGPLMGNGPGYCCSRWKRRRRPGCPPQPTTGTYRASSTTSSRTSLALARREGPARLRLQRNICRHTLCQICRHSLCQVLETEEEGARERARGREGETDIE